MRRSCVSAGFARKEVSLLKNKSLKKFICFAAVLVLMLGSLVFLASCGSADSDEIYIYNYGEYLADGITAGSTRVVRGGYYGTAWKDTRPSNREVSQNPGSLYEGFGLRLVTSFGLE